MTQTSKLVFVDNDKLATDSLLVAETFKKNHKEVLRDVRNLDCSEEFRQRNFAQSTYRNGQSRNMPKIIMTEQGFTFLVMGYTGKEAARFKETYINEFERMRSALNQLAVKPPQNPIDLVMYQADMFKNIAIAMAENQAKVLELEGKVGTVEAKAATKEEVNEIRKGLVDIDAPLTTDLQNLVNEYAKLTGKTHRETWHFLYDNLKSRTKLDIVRRHNNRVKKDSNYKGTKLDIIKELRLLPEAIRFMKVVNENLKLFAKQVQPASDVNDPF